MPVLDLTIDQLLTTTRSVRRRLDLDRPVEREVLLECLELAVQAPSGGNRQLWRWIFVTEPDLKGALADLYRQVFARYVEQARRGSLTEAGQRLFGSGQYLADHLHEVPVLLVPCLLGRFEAREEGGGWNQGGYWGSLLPATWSLCLALRSRGLGSVFTTMTLSREREVADVLGIPYDEVAQGGLMPIAYTRGTDFRAVARKPLDEIVHWNGW
jgi:nitroreductase